VRGRKGRSLVREQGAALRRGQLQRPRKEVQPHLSCLHVSSPTLDNTRYIPLTCPLPERHDHACQRQPSRATLITTDIHPPETLAPEQSSKKQTHVSRTAVAIQYSHCRTGHLTVKAAISATKD
jgi:hypothetical protein